MYNEEVGAERCIETMAAYVPKLPGNVKVIAIDDGSKDKTPVILKRLVSKHKHFLSVVTQSPNQGYGAALAAGLRTAYAQGFEYVLFMDSDLTNHPRDIGKFIELMPSGFDCVKATRYSLGGGMDGVPPYRYWMSWLGNQVAKRLFRMNLSDCTNGFRMVKTATTHSFKYTERGFGSILEELYQLKKVRAKCAEVPVILTSRIDTESHFAYNWPTIWSYLKFALKAAVC